MSIIDGIKKIAFTQQDKTVENYTTESADKSTNDSSSSETSSVSSLTAINNLTYIAMVNQSSLSVASSLTIDEDSYTGNNLYNLKSFLNLNDEEILSNIVYQTQTTAQKCDNEPQKVSSFCRNGLPYSVTYDEEGNIESVSSELHEFMGLDENDDNITFSDINCDDKNRVSEFTYDGFKYYVTYNSKGKIGILVSKYENGKVRTKETIRMNANGQVIKKLGYTLDEFGKRTENHYTTFYLTGTPKIHSENTWINNGKTSKRCFVETYNKDGSVVYSLEDNYEGIHYPRGANWRVVSTDENPDPAPTSCVVCFGMTKRIKIKQGDHVKINSEGVTEVFSDFTENATKKYVQYNKFGYHVETIGGLDKTEGNITNAIEAVNSIISSGNRISGTIFDCEYVEQDGYTNENINDNEVYTSEEFKANNDICTPTKFKIGNETNYFECEIEYEDNEKTKIKSVTVNKVKVNKDEDGNDSKTSYLHGKYDMVYVQDDEDKTKENLKLQYAEIYNETGKITNKVKYDSDDDTTAVWNVSTDTNRGGVTVYDSEYKELTNYCNQDKEIKNIVNELVTLNKYTYDVYDINSSIFDVTYKSGTDTISSFKLGSEKEYTEFNVSYNTVTSEVTITNGKNEYVFRYADDDTNNISYQDTDFDTNNYKYNYNCNRYFNFKEASIYDEAGNIAYSISKEKNVVTVDLHDCLTHEKGQNVYGTTTTKKGGKETTAYTFSKLIKSKNGSIKEAESKATGELCSATYEGKKITNFKIGEKTYNVTHQTNSSYYYVTYENVKYTILTYGKADNPQYKITKTEVDGEEV